MNFQPIATHPLDQDECILAIFDADGVLVIADRGGWTPGAVHEEWDKVDDGIAIKLYEEEEEGSWWSNHCVLEDPTHWAPLQKIERPKHGPNSTAVDDQLTTRTGE